MALSYSNRLRSRSLRNPQLHLVLALTIIALVPLMAR
jgi:hypothetical protein